MNIDRVHEINLMMLKEIDRICRKFDIKYRLDAGTFLGAIRHKGFIPWDDDCDIVFLRSEYEKFLDALTKEKLSDGMVFRRAKENKYFHDFIDRLYYTKEVYREGREFKDWFDGMFQYLWVDFFILDDVPDNNHNVITVQKIIYALATHFRNGQKFKKGNNVLINILMSIVGAFGTFTTIDKIYELQDKVSKKYSYLHDNEYVYFSNYPAIYLGYKMKKHGEKDLIYVDFEDTKMPVLKEYDSALKYYYGDYMKLPDSEKRVPEHKDNIW